jgi:hypothetical protein
MVNLDKATEQAEKSFIVRLEKEVKKTGIEHTIEAEVKFVVDISGSMNNSGMSGKLYSNGTVNNIMSRFYPVAKILDDNGDMEVYPFSCECKKLDVSVNENNYENFIESEIMNKKKSYYFSGTDYAPMINKIMNDVHDKLPQLCICIVDGNANDKSKARKAIIESAKTKTFFLFIGIGNKKNEFEFLESLDDISDKERLIDNVDFHYIKNIMTLSDKELYDIICNEFVGWFYKAKSIKLF